MVHVAIKISIVFSYLLFHVGSFWWSTGGELTPDVPTICRKTTKYRGSTKGMCENRVIIEEIMRGVRWALEECQLIMMDEKWNCSNRNSALVRLLKHDTKEAAFVRAIVSTGPIYSIVEACSRGSLDRCGCKTAHGRIHYKPRRHTDKHNLSSSSSSQDGERVFHLLKSHQYEQVSWNWRGCESNIGFAYRISKSFMDEPERRFGRDFKSDVHLHNYEAGRLASLHHMRKQCRCHGMSGSCVMQTCWSSLPYFVDVAQRLKLAYKKAVMVTSSNRHYDKGEKSMVPVPRKSTNSVFKKSKHRNNDLDHKKSLKRTKSRSRTIKRQSLVYSQESPNFCSYDESFGSLGTEDRKCELEGNTTKDCSSLCCGRGYKTEERVVESTCECKFEWCCDILCRECTSVVVEHRCR